MPVKRPTLLIVSPHPDDAFLSLGGWIQTQTRYDVVVWNLFSVQNYSLLDKDEKRAQERILDEERQVAKKAGVCVYFEALAEAGLRGYGRLSDMLGFTAVGSVEPELQREIKTRFLKLTMENEFRGFLLPLGVGGHIDHVLARDVLSAISSVVKKNRVFFYEELPYAQNASWLSRCLAWFEQADGPLSVHLIDVEDCLEQKAALLALYRSQLKQRDIRRIVSYNKSHTRLGARERVWSHKKTDLCLQ